MNGFLISFGLLPVLGFLILGGRGKERRALWGALALGAAETGYTFALGRGIDYLAVTAFLILGASVYLSLRARDDFFFKIHGAVANLLTAAVMLFAWTVLHKAMLLDAAEKYVGLDKLAALNPEIPKEDLAEFFRVLSLQLPIWLILHAALTVHAARRWSRWAWALVYGPGLFAALVLAAAFAQVNSLGR